MMSHPARSLAQGIESFHAAPELGAQSYNYTSLSRRCRLLWVSVAKPGQGGPIPYRPNRRQHSRTIVGGAL